MKLKRNAFVWLGLGAATLLGVRPLTTTTPGPAVGETTPATSGGTTPATGTGPGGIGQLLGGQTTIPTPTISIPTVIPPVVSSPAAPTTTPSVSPVVVTAQGSYIDNHAVGENPDTQRAIATAADAAQRAENAMHQAEQVYRALESTLIAYTNPDGTSGYYYRGATEDETATYQAAIQAYEDARLYLESIIGRR